MALLFVTLSVTVIWAMIRLFLGFLSFTFPEQFARMLTLTRHLPNPPNPRSNPFILLCGARRIALNILILLFAYEGKTTIVGTIMFCSVPIAMVDAVVTYGYGRREDAWVHGVGGCVIAILASRLTNG